MAPERFTTLVSIHQSSEFALHNRQTQHNRAAGARAGSPLW
jgi:hypothetical protein